MTKKSGILDFFGISKPLFVMSVLKGDNLQRFVNREDLLSYFVASIDMGQNCAVVGDHGSGKSSFLLKLMDRMKYCAYGDNSLHYFSLYSLSNKAFKLPEKIDEPIILFIDELDKVGRYPLESPEWDKEVMKILELSREIMLESKLILVFALQNELYEKLKLSEINKGDKSIFGLINAFKKIEGFNLEFAREAVEVNLEYAGYKGGIESLFQHGVIEIVLAETDGNPRLFMHYLIELTKHAYLERQQKISLELLKKYFLEIGKLNEKEWNSLVEKIPAPIKDSDRKELL